MSCERSSREETCRLIDEAHAGNKDAIERLVVENAGLVSMAARRFASSSYETEDLMQIGYIGLLKAIDRFDPEYGVMFSTYAVPMIIGEIRRFLRDDGRVKVSRQLKQSVRELKRTEEDFMQRRGRSPRLSELAAAMQLSVGEVTEMLEARNVLSGMVSIDDDGLAAAGMPEPAAEGENEDMHADVMDVRNMLAELSERERSVIVMRYFGDMTQQQTGERLGISQVQVSRIEKRVLKLMRENMINICQI